jgi:hypothetical protein
VDRSEWRRRHLKPDASVADEFYMSRQKCFASKCIHFQILFEAVEEIVSSMDIVWFYLSYGNSRMESLTR